MTDHVRSQGGPWRRIGGRRHFEGWPGPHRAHAAAAAAVPLPPPLPRCCRPKLPCPPRPAPEATIQPDRTEAMTSVRYRSDLPLVHRPLLGRGDHQSDDGRRRLLPDAPPMPVSRVPENPKSPPRSFRRRTARDQAEFQAVHHHLDRRRFRRRVPRRPRPNRSRWPEPSDPTAEPINPPAMPLPTPMTAPAADDRMATTAKPLTGAAAVCRARWLSPSR